MLRECVDSVKFEILTERARFGFLERGLPSFAPDRDPAKPGKGPATGTDQKFRALASTGAMAEGWGHLNGQLWTLGRRFELDVEMVGVRDATFAPVLSVRLSPGIRRAAQVRQEFQSIPFRSRSPKVR
jgi:hypothetical protein